MEQVLRLQYSSKSILYCFYVYAAFRFDSKRGARINENILFHLLIVKYDIVKNKFGVYFG